MSSNLAIGLVIGASVVGALSGISQVGKALTTLRDTSLSTSDKVTAMFSIAKGTAKTAFSTITGLSTGILALSQPAIAFESAMADVKKVVDFKTPDGFKNLSKDILELTRTLPMSAEELAAITASGGQLGVAEADLKDFTTTIAKMSVAFDMSANESGDAMAKLANVYKIPISEIGNLGDAINELSNSSPAKASDIVNTLGRIGGTAKQFGLTENAAAALSNSFISLGKSPEVAGTAINGMLTKLMTAEKGGKEFQAALKSMGLNAKQLKTAIGKDAQGALTDFLKRLEKLPKDKQMGTLVDLFGREYADDVAVLAGNVDILDKSLATLQETDANGKPKYLGSMQKEFEARAATTENNLKLLKNSFAEIATTVGSTLLPVINNLVNATMPYIHVVADWIGQNQELVGTILKIVMAGGAGFAALNVFVGVATTGIGIFFKMKSVLGFVSGAATVFSGVVSKLAYGVGFLIGKTIKIGQSALLLGRIVSGVLSKGLTLAGKAVLFLSRALLANPIGLAVTGIATAAYLIYQYWEPIKGFFSGLWNWVTGAFQTAANAISQGWTAVSNWFGSVWESIKSGFSAGITAIGTFISNFNPLALFQSIFSAVLNWFGVELPTTFSGFGRNIIDGLVDGIKNAWDLAKQKVGELGDGIKSWFKDKLGINSPSRVFLGFGVNIVEGLTGGLQKTKAVAKAVVQSMGDQMIAAMPAKISAPTLDTSPALSGLAKLAGVTQKEMGTAAQKMQARRDELLGKTTPKTTALVKRRAKKAQAPQENTLLGINPSEYRLKPTQIAQPAQGFWGNLWDSAKSGLTEFGKNIDFGWGLLKNGIGQFWDNLIAPQEDFRMTTFNPQQTDYLDYQPINRQAVTQPAPQAENGGIVVHFSPTINVNGAGADVAAQVQNGLQMGLHEFEELLNRVLDQRQRRAY